MRGTSAESTGRGLALANFPIGGGLRLISDVAGCWGDLWVSTELQFRFATSRTEIGGFVIVGDRAGDLESQELRATVDGRTWTLQCGPGAFEWTVPIAVKAGASATVHISGRARVAARVPPVTQPTDEAWRGESGAWPATSPDHDSRNPFALAARNASQ
jgi:hypothetical protein